MQLQNMWLKNGATKWPVRRRRNAANIPKSVVYLCSSVTFEWTFREFVFECEINEWCEWYSCHKVEFLVHIMRDKHEEEIIIREIINILALRARTPRTRFETLLWEAAVSTVPWNVWLLPKRDVHVPNQILEVRGRWFATRRHRQRTIWHTYNFETQVPQIKVRRSNYARGRKVSLAFDRAQSL